MNFNLQVQRAYEAAGRASAPFIPSRAQVEACLQELVVNPLLAMTEADAREVIRGGAGGLRYDSIAVQMYKAQRRAQSPTQPADPTASGA